MVVISEFFYPCAFGKERVLSRRWPVVKPRRFEVAINVLAELLLSGRPRVRRRRSESNMTSFKSLQRKCLDLDAEVAVEK